MIAEVVAVLAVLTFLFLYVRHILEFKRWKRPVVCGGVHESMAKIVDRMPMMSMIPSVPLYMPGLLQLAIFGIQSRVQEYFIDNHWEFKREEVQVTLEGNSALPHTDTVAVQWLLGRKNEERLELPEDAPIVLLCPGLSCYAKSLPGTHPYEQLYGKGWRIAVFEKRAVGPPGTEGLNAPILHMYGHPSDLHKVVMLAHNRYPKAPLHLMGFSSGNGLTASYTVLYGPSVPWLRSSILLIGGEDYNVSFAPAHGNRMTRVLFDGVLLPLARYSFLSRNEAILKPHNPEGYQEAMLAPTLQEMYEACMTHFSGYKDRKEAEEKINPFGDGTCECLRHVKTPFLVVYTDDDPVSPGGPRPSWVKTISACEWAQLAIFPSGSHLGCYDSWHFTRWVDKLAVQWVQACEAVLGETKSKK